MSTLGLTPEDLCRPWRELPVTVIDFETTGLDPKVDKPVEIGLVRFEGGEEVARFTSLVNPEGVAISEGAGAVHGITDAEVQDAPTLTEAVVKGLDLLEGALPAGYNGHFDREFLHRGVDLEGPLALSPDWVWLDPLVMIRKVDRYVRGKGRHKLTVTCKRHGIPLEGAHRAVNDCAATGKLLFKLIQGAAPTPIEEFLAQQETRAKQQNADLEAWKARQGA